MPASLWLEQKFLQALDALAALRPASTPGRAQLKACRIISHRGERDDRRVFENTCAAFDPLRGSGVHGIEFDVRWTRDLVPVVFHDSDMLRLFNDPRRIDQLNWPELQQQRPEISDLHSLVRRYLDEFHLMVELKFEPLRDPALQNRRLCEALAPALERQRCHVLSLTPEMLSELPGLPAARTLGVSRFNTADISSEALALGRAGIAAHYLALRAGYVGRHHAAGQVVGCGFPRTRAVLLHEIARGVDYVFSNDARTLELWRREAAALL